MKDIALLVAVIFVIAVAFTLRALYRSWQQRQVRNLRWEPDFEIDTSRNDRVVIVRKGGERELVGRAPSTNGERFHELMSEADYRAAELNSEERRYLHR